MRVGPLLAIDTPVAVMFIGDFSGSAWIHSVTALHSHRPDVGLICVAGPPERALLRGEFEGVEHPPLVVTETASAETICDALRLTRHFQLAQSLERSFDPAAAAAQLARPLLEVSTLLAQGRLHDSAFDRLMPARLRAASERFWTPIEVAVRAAAWFEDLGVRSVVDIGSGVGKFCIASALASSCSFVGIEQRPRLVNVARNLAWLLGVQEQVSFVDGRFGEVEIPRADCYYLYNPFEENLFSTGEALDDHVELSKERFRQSLHAFRALVSLLPVGAYILTYNGVGGRMPNGLDEVRVDRELPAVLRLLRKAR
ncbi:MAG TPA: hypothetical protein VHB79_04435 [Polyangiaceae bacterium]|nr:hypothetical protein [Polyangiaceae bacterium]